MKRAALVVAVFAVLISTFRPAAQQSAAASERDLVGTWTLASVQQGVDSPKPTRVQNPRGLLVFDATGHVIEVITRGTIQPIAGMTDAQARFLGFGGSWGAYAADLRGKKLTYKPVGGVSPNVMGGEFSRSFDLAGDILTVTSLPGEPHTQGLTRWTWERVPTVDNLSPGYRNVVGFWEHVVERRVAATGAVLSESKRAPSVIVYTPSGYVGVHFPPLNRQRFAATEPTDAEARAALSGYIGYYGALGVYPGMVFHQILAGLSPSTGTTLKRLYELAGDQLTVRLLPTNGQQGDSMTVVTLKRLSGAAEMLPGR
jgi:hypothetical protein